MKPEVRGVTFQENLRDLVEYAKEEYEYCQGDLCEHDNYNLAADQSENQPDSNCDQCQLSSEYVHNRDDMMREFSTGRQRQSAAGAVVVFRQLGRLSPRHTSLTELGDVDNGVTEPEVGEGVGREVSSELDRVNRTGKSVRVRAGRQLRSLRNGSRRG